MPQGNYDSWNSVASGSKTEIIYINSFLMYWGGKFSMNMF